MRRVAGFVLLSLAACSEAGPAGPQGPQGERGPEGPPGGTAAVATLEARVAMLEAQLAAVVAARKVPHLVVRATGQDLGPFAGIDRAYSALLGEYYRIEPVVLMFLTDNCTGEAYASTNAVGLIVASDGRIVDVESSAVNVDPVSTLDGVSCRPVGFKPLTIRRAVDTGARGVSHSPDELAITLR